MLATRQVYNLLQIPNALIDCEAGLPILQENRVISQNIGHHDDSQPHSCHKHCSCSPRWTAGLYFWQKWTRRWVAGSVGCRSFLIFLISHMVLLWTLTLLAKRCGRMLPLNMLTPSLSPPNHTAPGALKNTIKLLPRTGLSREKKRWSKEQTALVTINHPRLASNSGIMWRKKVVPLE